MAHWFYNRSNKPHCGVVEKPRNGKETRHLSNIRNDDFHDDVSIADLTLFTTNMSPNVDRCLRGEMEFIP
jgi:hypothetical protein